MLKINLIAQSVRVIPSWKLKWRRRRHPSRLIVVRVGMYSVADKKEIIKWGKKLKIQGDLPRMRFGENISRRQHFISREERSFGTKLNGRNNGDWICKYLSSSRFCAKGKEGITIKSNPLDNWSIADQTRTAIISPIFSSNEATKPVRRSGIN